MRDSSEASLAVANLDPNDRIPTAVFATADTAPEQSPQLMPAQSYGAPCSGRDGFP